MPSNHEADDAVARTVAENKVTDLLIGAGVVTAGADTDTARYVFGAMVRRMSFQTAVRNVGGEEIRLRRLVMVGEWEVDPNGKPNGK